MEKAKKMKCYNRLIYKQFFQVSGLCGPQFPSYLPKHFTHHCRLCMETPSLRSKRFQSSYCAKVRAGAKKKSPPPPLSFLFLLSSQLSRQTRAETLATQASILTFCQERILQFCSNCKSLFNLLVSSR